MVVDESGDEVPPGGRGECLIFSPWCFGFYGAPELTKESWDADGWEHSGDVLAKDENGLLSIVGRTKEMILRGAQNIFPKEIEDILSKHPKIKQVAIVKMPDKELGEKACAFVIATPRGTVTLEDLTSFLEGRKVTKYKWPERVEVIEQMPLSSGGKILKRELEENIARKLNEEGKV